MPVGNIANAAIGAVGSIAGSVVGANAAGRAGNAQETGSANAQKTLQDQYNQTRGDLAPYRGAGTDALSALESFYGIGGKSPGNWQQTLNNLPGYQFQMQSGAKAVNQNLAARGLLQSGAAGKALTQYGQGLGSQYANQYAAGLYGLAGMGETATAQTGAFGQNAANGIGDAQIYSGNAQAQSIIGTGKATQAGLSGLFGSFGMGMGDNQQYQANNAQITGGVNDIYSNLGQYGLT